MVRCHFWGIALRIFSVAVAYWDEERKWCVELKVGAFMERTAEEHSRRIWGGFGPWEWICFVEIMLGFLGWSLIRQPQDHGCHDRWQAAANLVWRRVPLLLGNAQEHSWWSGVALTVRSVANTYTHLQQSGTVLQYAWLTGWDEPRERACFGIHMGIRRQLAIQVFWDLERRSRKFLEGS